MANTPNFPAMDPNDEFLTRNQEESERLINEVEQQNDELILESLQFQANITNIQTGVRDSVMTTLQNVFPNESQVAITARERVQSELYRAVEGNKGFEEDKSYGGQNANIYNLENSLSRNKLRGSVTEKTLFQGRKMVRGAFSLIGGDNLVESEVEKRFGSKNNTVQERIKFTAARAVNDLAANNQDVLEGIVGILNHHMPAVSPYVIANLAPIIDALAAADARVWQAISQTNAQAQNKVLADYVLIKRIEGREAAKIAAEKVFDIEDLHDFNNKLLTSNRPLHDKIHEILDQNALWPLDKNPEGQALMALIRHNFNKYGANTLIQELQFIQNDLPKEHNQSMEGLRSSMETAFQTITDKKRLNLVKANRLIQLKARLEAKKADIEIARRNVRNLENANRKKALARANDALNTLLSERNSLQQQFDTELQNQNNEESALISAAEELNNLLNSNGIVAPQISNLLNQLRNSAPINENDLLQLSANPAPATTTSNTIFNVLTQTSTTDWDLAANELQGVIPMSHAKITPFQLMQRMLRRDYLRTRAPHHNPAHYHERAARYSLMKASMMVQDVKNVDLYRNSNQKAVQYLKKGRALRLGRAADLAASNFNELGRKIGLEIIEGKRQKSDSIIEQVILTDERKFGIFKGLNKFSTSRDIRLMLDKNATEVTSEMLDEFIGMLEGVLLEFKQAEVIDGDWDLENLIIALQKVKLERWNREFMNEVINSSGNKETAMLGLLRSKREEDERVSREIYEGVNSADALWKKQLSKNELKKVLNKKTREAQVAIRNSQIATNTAEIARLQDLINELPEGNTRRLALERQVVGFENQNKALQKDNLAAQDLADKTAVLKQHLAEGQLSNKDAKAMAASLGIGQVYDKMSTNFRLERYWNKTKKAADWTWDKTKKSWHWSREAFLNSDTAKKGWSVMRYAATPVTASAGFLWKVGSFPFKLVGKAAMGTLRLPGRVWRAMSKSAQAKYVRETTARNNYKAEEIAEKVKKLQSKKEKAAYKWDKKRINEKIIKLESSIAELKAENDNISRLTA